MSNETTHRTTTAGRDTPPASVGGRAAGSAPDSRRRDTSTWWALAGFIVAAQAAGLLGTFFTDREVGGWYDRLDKPPFNPPSWVFGPVWTTLYVLIGVAAWRVWRTHASESRSRALTWWVVQLAVNAAWTPLFFGAQAPAAALVEILVLGVAVALTIRTFDRVDRLAAVLLVPYAAWVAFATVLNATIVVLN